MHAGTEQLLTIRDGGLVDAGIAQHVADCAECRDQLAQLRAMSDALRDLPQLSPPAGAWSALVARMDEPVGHRRGWLSGAVAAAALIAVAIWQWGGGDAVPAQTQRVATAGSDSTDAVIAEPLQASRATATEAADAPELDTLVSQSQRLEQLLRELDSSTPRVMNAGTAGTIAGLQDGIAYIDYGLSYDERLDQAQSEQLWRQRVELMNTLVQVRGAQLQQVSN